MEDEILFKIVNFTRANLRNFLDHKIFIGPFNEDKAIRVQTMTNLMHTRFILQYVHYNPLHVSSITCSSSGG